MTIEFSNLGASATPDFANTTDATSFATSSWVPPTEGLILLFIFSRMTTSGGVTPSVPAVTGNGLTWTEIETITFFNSGGVPYGRLTLLAAAARNAAPGVTTINFGSDTQTMCAVSFFGATGVDLEGGVAGAFVQTITDSWFSNNAPTSTLAAAGNPKNRAIAGWAHAANEVIDPRAGWTEMDDLRLSSPNSSLETQVRGDAFETTVGCTFVSASADVVVVAAELKALVTVYVDVTARDKRNVFQARKKSVEFTGRAHKSNFEARAKSVEYTSRPKKTIFQARPKD